MDTLREKGGSARGGPEVPDMDGMEVIREVKEKRLPQVIVITAYPSVFSAVDAMKPAYPITCQTFREDDFKTAVSRPSGKGRKAASSKAGQSRTEEIPLGYGGRRPESRRPKPSSHPRHGDEQSLAEGLKMVLSEQGIAYPSQTRVCGPSER